VRQRLFFPLALASFAAGCASFGGDVAGLFYRVQLQEPPPSTACLDIAGDLTREMGLHVQWQMVRPNGQCFVDLGDEEHPDRPLINVVSDPQNRRLALHVSEFSRSGSATPRTQELASQLLAIVQGKLPEAVITSFKSSYSLLGP
jgi:hypothetical protein